MLNLKKVTEEINERIRTLKSSDTCALFLLSAEKKEQKEYLNPEYSGEQKERMASLLTRFFRQTDFVEYVGDHCFLAFLTGQLTEQVVWEKASTLSEALGFASENSSELIPGYVGVCLFQGTETTGEAALRKAEYALEMAKKEENRRLYICTESGNGIAGFPISPEQAEVAAGYGGFQERQLLFQEKREWLQFLAEKSDCQLWEVELASRTLRVVYAGKRTEKEWLIYENFPESLVEMGKIHKDSVKRFREFAGELLDGKAGDSANFMVQFHQTGCYGWASMSYHMLYNEDGHPIKAIGIKENLSYTSGKKPGYILRRTMPAALYPHLHCYIQADLTEDKVEIFQLEGREQARLMHGRPYTEIVKHGTSRMFSAEDVRRFQWRFGREQLLEKFDKGKRWFFDRCRVVNPEGTIQWISIGMNLTLDSETGHVCLFAYLSNRNQRLKWERELKATVGLDPVTGVYDLETAERMIRHILSAKEQTVCAVAEIRVGGMGELLEENSRHRKEIVTALNIFLDTDCVLGTDGKGSVLAFFPHPVSRERLRKRLEDSFSFTRLSFEGVPEFQFLRFIAGVECRSMETADLEDMKCSVHKLCLLHESEAEDAVFFFDPALKYEWSDVELGEKNIKNMDSQPLEPTGIMTESEKDMVLDCMSLMLKSRSLDASIDGVLMNVGQYYQADRVYILALTEDRRLVTMLNEWVRKGKCSIQQSVSGKKTSSYPVIERYAKNPGPIFLSMREPLPDGTGERVSWQYVILPMEKVGGLEQIFCIENPRRGVERTALLNKLIPYISSERNRFLGVHEKMSPLDRLYALPNYQDCMNTAYAVDSDMYSSLGVLAVDIPNFVHMKEQKGYEYGSHFLLRISEVLRDVFGSHFLFHTKESEFIIFCVNATYESFLNQCARAKHLIGRQYSGQFRIGCTWSNGIFKAADLMSKARSLMKCAGFSESPLIHLSENRETELKENRQVEAVPGNDRKLTIYLQPKVDMSTKELVGAEALVRVMDGNGKLLPHGQMIESMEKNGTIQELDYFVFDRMLETLSQWKKKGYALKPVSSNFSRNTLLNPSSLASVLAILSRYPEIPQELVELEITETAGDFENNTFSEMIRRFGEYGFQFSLDDFGSSYSSMSMLANLHFRSVKLDRSMIRSITVNQVSRTMVRDVIKICQECGMVCIAEGVETMAQAQTLLADGGRYAQGYYYGKPMPVEEFEKKYLRL